MKNVSRVVVVCGIVLINACLAFAYKAPLDQWTWQGLTASGEPWWYVSGAYRVAAGDGKVYVTSLKNNYIKVYSFDGEPMGQFGGTGSGPGELSSPRGVALNGEELYICDNGNGRVQVVSTNGVFRRSWGTAGSEAGQFSGMCGVAVDANSVYVLQSSGAYRVQVFDHTGGLVRAWGSYGTLPGQFTEPTGIAVDKQYVYVADKPSRTVTVFTKDGAFVRRWQRYYHTTYMQDWGPYAIAVDDSHVYLASGSPATVGGTDWWTRFQVYSKEGRLLWEHAIHQERLNNGPRRRPLLHPRGVALSGNWVFIADNGYDPVEVGWESIVRYRRIARTFGTVSSRENSYPQSDVLGSSQRQGTSILDVDYVVTDSSTPTVAAYPLAFTTATPSLASCVPLRTLIEGTEDNIGNNITVGVTNRISWEVGEDWYVNYGDIRIAILAKDDRELLDIHWLHLPPVSPNPALTINRYPITENDLLNLWFWVIASGNTTVTLAGGQVTGVGGGYDGELLASDAGMTARGREFLFDMLGCREATAAELVQAREASTPGSVTQWTPRYTLPTGVPRKVNEFGFDSGSTDAHGWWVVKE